MAIGDINTVVIRPDGWSAAVTVSGFNNFPQFLNGFDGNYLNDPLTGAPTMTLVVQAKGYDATGAPTTVNRTIYGTTSIRGATDDVGSASYWNASTDGTNSTLVVALSDYVYASDTIVSCTFLAKAVGQAVYNGGGRLYAGATQQSLTFSLYAGNGRQGAFNTTLTIPAGTQFQAGGVVMTVTSTTTITGSGAVPLSWAGATKFDILGGALIGGLPAIPSNAGTPAVTNNSPINYPGVIANWECIPNQKAGSSLTVRACAFHWAARNGLPVACVKFFAQDQSGHTSPTVTVTAPTIDSTQGDALPVIEYIATLDLSSMTQNDIVTVHFQAFPWIGDAGAVADTTSIQTSLWTANVVYVAGQYVTNNGNTYVCTVGGASAASGGPSGTGSSIVDNAATWNFVSVNAPSGYYSNWARNTAYVVGQQVVAGLASAYTYECTVAGTSATTGTGPTVTSGTQTDGGATWKYIGLANPQLAYMPRLFSPQQYLCDKAGTYNPYTVVVDSNLFPPWTPSATYAAGGGILVQNGANVYQCTTGGVAASSGGPTGKGIADGSVCWNYAGAAGTYAAWVASAPYIVGQYVSNGGNAYICTQAGTSASSGGPSGTGIVDGGAIWKWIQGGAHQPWTTGVAYTVGQTAYNAGLLYTCTIAGTSGGTAPTGTGTGISDGGVTWDYRSQVPIDYVFRTSAPVVAGQVCSANGNVYFGIVGGYCASSGTGPTGTGNSIADSTVTWAYVCAASAVGETGAAQTSFAVAKTTPFRTIGSALVYGQGPNGLQYVLNSYYVANSPAWAATTTYKVGQIIHKGTSVYVCTQAGTSASTGPSGTPTAFVDGTVIWRWKGDYAGTVVYLRGGNYSWMSAQHSYTGIGDACYSNWPFIDVLAFPGETPVINAISGLTYQDTWFHFKGVTFDYGGNITFTYLAQSVVWLDHCVTTKACTASGGLLYKAGIYSTQSLIQGMAGFGSIITRGNLISPIGGSVTGPGFSTNMVGNKKTNPQDPWSFSTGNEYISSWGITVQNLVPAGSGASGLITVQMKGSSALNFPAGASFYFLTSINQIPIQGVLAQAVALTTSYQGVQVDFRPLYGLGGTPNDIPAGTTGGMSYGQMDNLIVAFNVSPGIASVNMKNGFWSSGGPSLWGSAVIQNLMESYQGGSNPILTIGADGTFLGPINNFIMWHNTACGAKQNTGYNESGVAPMGRKYFNLKNDAFDGINIKSDNWSVSTYHMQLDVALPPGTPTGPATISVHGVDYALYLSTVAGGFYCAPGSSFTVGGFSFYVVGTTNQLISQTPGVSTLNVYITAIPGGGVAANTTITSSWTSAPTRVGNWSELYGVGYEGVYSPQLEQLSAFLRAWIGLRGYQSYGAQGPQWFKYRNKTCQDETTYVWWLTGSGTSNSLGTADVGNIRTISLATVAPAGSFADPGYETYKAGQRLVGANGLEIVFQSTVTIGPVAQNVPVMVMSCTSTTSTQYNLSVASNSHRGDIRCDTTITSGGTYAVGKTVNLSLRVPINTMTMHSGMVLTGADGSFTAVVNPVSEGLVLTQTAQNVNVTVTSIQAAATSTGIGSYIFSPTGFTHWSNDADYRPTAASPLIVGSRVKLLPYDLAGAVRSDGMQISGAYHPKITTVDCEAM